MQIHVNERDGYNIVTVIGEIDLHTAPDLRTCLADLVLQGRVEIVVDLTALDFIDSSGLGVLVGALNRARAAGGTVDLVIARESITKLFRITGLVKVFEIDQSLEEAVANRPTRGQG